MKINHVSIVAKDADKLAIFYIDVFGCKDFRPRRVLSGERVWRGNGLAHVDIYSVWLSFPVSNGPILELLQYTAWLDRAPPAVNEAGYGHIAFEVMNIDATYAAIISGGGTAVGEITNFGTADTPHRIVYMRDSQGNILEIEQG